MLFANANECKIKRNLPYQYFAKKKKIDLILVIKLYSPLECIAK